MTLKLSKNERDLLLNLCTVSEKMYSGQARQFPGPDSLAHEIKARQYSHLATKLEASK